MKNSSLFWVIAAFVAAATYFALVEIGPPADPTPAPLVQPQPQPDARPLKPAPDCPNCPRPREAGEEEPTVDLLAVPAQFRKRNIESKGSGCCTFRSAEYAAYWANLPAIYGLPEYMKANGIEGGGWPAKQAQMIQKIAESRNMPVPAFVQYEGADPGIIELALKTGRLPCVTWDRRSHMLNCVHLDGERAAIVDNNAPDRVQWMSRQRFLQMWSGGTGGWVFLFLNPGPPPPPAGNPVRTGCMPKKPCLCSIYCECGCNQGRECFCEGSKPEKPKKDDKPVEPMDPDKDQKEHKCKGGVSWVYSGEESYSIDGNTCTRTQVEAALQDDSYRLYLTLAGGTAQARDAALASLGDAVQNYRVQSYDRGHWALNCGFVVAEGDTPTLYLQRTDRTVALKTPATGNLTQKLRRADPTYRPLDTPNGKPAFPRLPPGSLPWLGAGGALAAAYALWKLNQPQGTPQVQQQPQPQPSQPQPQNLHPADLAAIQLGRQVLANAANTVQPQPQPQPPR